MKGVKMNRKKILLIAGILLCIAAGTQAQEADEARLGVDLDATWVSKYLWHGFDLFDDKAAFQPSVNVDFWGSGFSFNYWASIPCSSGLVNLTEYDYTVAYDRTVFEGEKYATDVTANYIYYDFPDEPDRAADGQELGVGFAWPNILPAGVVPSYYVGKIWASKSDSDLGSDFGGFIHVFGLGYDLTVPGILPDTSEQTLSLTADLTYNDGYGSATAEHDWSHATLGISSGFEIGGATFTPALYYQISMDDSVNDEDEIWVGLSLTYRF